MEDQSSSSVLADIITDVYKDTAERKKTVSLSELQKKIENLKPAHNVVASIASRAKTGNPIIAEVKRSSPSKGKLSDIESPANLAQTYESAGAVAVSVLTEKRRFKGCLEDLDQVRQAVDIPVLRKDFMVEDYQFYEARAHGADIVLLIVAAIKKQEELIRLFKLAHDLGMTVLVETHSEEEVDRALELDPKLLGINVRNLKTLEIDPDHFQHLYKYAQKQLKNINNKSLIVAESGVNSPEQVRQYRSQGADAVLVGEALVKTSDVDKTLREYITV